MQFNFRHDLQQFGPQIARLHFSAMMYKVIIVLVMALMSRADATNVDACSKFH